MAYSELYFSPTLWPDWGQEELFAALDSFGCRDRRFGGQVPVAAPPSGRRSEEAGGP